MSCSQQKILANRNAQNLYVYPQSRHYLNEAEKIKLQAIFHMSDTSISPPTQFDDMNYT